MSLSAILTKFKTDLVECPSLDWPSMYELSLLGPNSGWISGLDLRAVLFREGQQGIYSTKPGEGLRWEGHIFYLLIILSGHAEPLQEGTWCQVCSKTLQRGVILPTPLFLPVPFGQGDRCTYSWAPTPEETREPCRWLLEEWVHWSLCLSFSLLCIPLHLIYLLGPTCSCPMLGGFCLKCHGWLLREVKYGGGDVTGGLPFLFFCFIEVRLLPSHRGWETGALSSGFGWNRHCFSPLLLLILFLLHKVT